MAAEPVNVENVEAVLEELEAEGRVVKRDGRWGLASWSEERWQLPEPTEEEAKAKLAAARGRTGDTDAAADLLGATPRQGPVPGTLAMKLGTCWVDGCGNDAYTRARLRDAATGEQHTGLICPDHIEQSGGVGGFTDLKATFTESLDRIEATTRAYMAVDADRAALASPDRAAAEAQVERSLDALVATGQVVRDGNRYRMADEEPGTTRPLSRAERDDLIDTLRRRLDAGESAEELTAKLTARGVDGLLDEAVDMTGPPGRRSFSAPKGTGIPEPVLAEGVPYRIKGLPQVDVPSLGEYAQVRTAKQAAWETRAAALLAESKRLHETPVPGDLDGLERRIDAEEEMVSRLRHTADEGYVDAHKAERDSESVAEIVAQIMAGKVIAGEGTTDIFAGMLGMWDHPKVIDATPIYHQAVGKGEWNAYEDHPCIAPPFGEFVIGYRNQFGNVILMHTVTIDAHEADQVDPATVAAVLLGRDWATANEVDWDRVRWRLFVTLWLGGKGGGGQKVPTSGPWYGWKIAVYDDGEPADITWVELGGKPGSDWDMAHCTYLDALYYLNARNVEVVEPRRSRGFARRMGRLGVKVGQIRVFPAGRTARSGRGEGIPVGTDSPAHAVRGHWAEYGVNGKGLLFGKYSGRFFIHPHFRGNPEIGENDNSYKLVGGG